MICIYTVRKNGKIVFSSKPMSESQALAEAAQYAEAEVTECEEYFGQDDEINFQA
jgi:hypothetical protein